MKQDTDLCVDKSVLCWINMMNIWINEKKFIKARHWSLHCHAHKCLFNNKLISEHSSVLTAQHVCIPWACCMFVAMCQCPGLHCVPCACCEGRDSVEQTAYRQQGTRHSTLSQQSGSLTWEYLTPSVNPIDKWYSPPEGLVSGLARSQWLPTKDTYLWKLYSLDTTGGKSRNTASLYRRFTLNIRLIVVVLISKYCLDQ